MIVFNLKCGNDHGFEAWFRDGATYEQQAGAGEILCPVCGDSRVSKAPMAPRLVKSLGEAPPRPAEAAPAGNPAELRRLLVELRQWVEANCDYVGERFPEKARKIHYGEVDPRPIYGEASAEEVRELAEEGVEFGRIPWLPRDS